MPSGRGNERAAGRRTLTVGAASCTARATRPPGRITLLGPRDDAVTALQIPRRAIALAAPPAAGDDAAAERSAGGVHDLRRHDAETLADARTPRSLRLVCDLVRDPAR